MIVGLNLKLVIRANNRGELYISNRLFPNQNPAGADGGPFSRVCTGLTLRQPLKFCIPQILLFCDCKLCAKFQNPRTTPSGRKVCDPERRKEERKIIPKIVDTIYSYLHTTLES